MIRSKAWLWLRHHLFAGPFDTLVTLTLGPVLAWGLFTLTRWALWGADWSVVSDNLQVMMVGTFPSEFLVRAWCWAAVLGVLVGMTLGAITPMSGPFLRLALVVAAGLVAVACLATSSGFLPACACLVGALVAWVAATLSVKLRKRVALFWLAGLVASAALLEPVGLDQWGGLMLGVMMTLLASALSIPLGVLLAFGRRSRLASMRIICLAYIELMRSLPLILVVYWIWVVTPLVAPDTPIPGTLRGLMGFSLFFAAYVAEYVRSGLQAVPKGQTEAAASLGMSQVQISREIVLPQALKVVTPALVGNVLDIFNNVPLLFIIGLTEFLRAGQMVLANPQSASKTYELYAFMFMVYLTTASLLTFGARRLEKRMAASHR